MKKIYVKPTIEALGLEEEGTLLTGSVITDEDKGAIWIGSRDANAEFSDDDDDYDSDILQKRQEFIINVLFFFSEWAQPVMVCAFLFLNAFYQEYNN